MALEVYHWSPTRTYQGNIDNYNAIQARNAAATAASLNNQQLTLNTRDPNISYASTNLLPNITTSAAAQASSIDLGLENDTTFKSEIDKKRKLWLTNDDYGSGKSIKPDNISELPEKDDAIQIWMHEQVTTKYKDFNPHVSGFYYIHMVPGTWVTDLLSLSIDNSKKGSDNKFGEFSSGVQEVTDSMLSKFGQYATDIDIPQLNMEYEVISGKSRSLNYATRTNYTGDFTINFIEDYNLNVFRYHELWFKYIEALRKGYLPSPTPSPDSDMFMEIPYFNAIWVAIFKPFSTKIQGLIKIMGVSPVSLPFKQVLGDRAKNTLTTINTTYKSTDMIHKFYKTNNEDLKSSEFYKEFIADITKSKEKQK